MAFSKYPNFIITEPVTNQDFVTLWNKKTKDMFVLVALKLVKSFIDLSTQRLSLDVFIVWLLGFLGFMLKSTFVTFQEIWKEKTYIPVWVSISDGHWEISIHFQKICEIVGCTSEKKSDFHMTHEEIIFKLLLFDEFFGHVEIWFPHDPCRNHF